MTPNEIVQDCCKNYGLFLPSQTDTDKDNKKSLQRIKMVYCTLQMGKKTYKRSKQTVFDFTLLHKIQWKDQEVLDTSSEVSAFTKYVHTSLNYKI